jgi:UDP-N-acetylmuramate--alanine ligase
MAKSDIETCQDKLNAAHTYKMVDYPKNLDLTGKRFHFIGAGGIGMSGLAKLMMKNKALVSGSDQTESRVVEELRKGGADIRIGHSRSNLPADTDAVVYSAAIKMDNPELMLARTDGVKTYKYAQMLGLLCWQYEAIAIAGTHGKSTTSGWLVYLLKQAGIDTNFTIGADITQLNASSGAGESKYFVAEACEYDRSFLNISPKIACILNIEADHLDYFKHEEEIVEAFIQFALGLKQGGVLIASGNDPNVAKVICKLPAGFRCRTFGLNENCDYSARNIQLTGGLSTFDVYYNGNLLGPAGISLPGKHNILNALAVIAVASAAGVEHEKIIELLAGFTGIDRRLMLKNEISGITILDDYAHHPTEIRASLAAIRQKYQPKRIWCVFQPHQYSRTRFLLDDFAESFKLADITIVPEIYFVRDTQQSRKEINSRVLVERIESNGTQALFIESFSSICDYLKKNVTSGDVVVTMGAGDIWKVADEYIQWLGANR